MSQGATVRPAWRTPAAWLVMLLTFAVALSLDLVTKSIAFRYVGPEPVELDFEFAHDPRFQLPPTAPVHAVPGDVLDFSLVVNHGAVFGIAQNRRAVFIAFTIGAVFVALWVFGWWTGGSRLAHAGIGLVLAGGVGNLTDRLLFGAVRDFLHIFPRWHLPFGLHWPGGGSSEVFPWVFNLADVELLLGMGFLLLALRGRDHATARAPAAELTSSPVNSAESE